MQIPNVTQGNLMQNRLNAGYIGPSDLALDRWGDLYASSTYAQRIIRSHWNGKYFDKLSQTYIGFTVGVAVDANDSLYSVSPYSSYFLRIPDSLSLTIPLILYAQQLNQRVSPAAIATDGFGNIFLLDSTTNRLLLLPATAGGYGSPIVLDSDLNAPTSLALDPLGNIYVADTGNNRIVKIMPSIPNSLAFQPTFLNQTSTDSPDPIALVNLGNQPFTLTSLNFPPDFPQQPAAGACASGTVLAPSTSCALAPGFVPTQPGSPLLESLTLTESGPGLLASSQSISVSGNTLAQSSQSITIQPIANLQYGTSPVAISASASSGLPVKVFVLSGPGVTCAHGTQLIVTGAGLITLQATQSGSAVYSAAAPVIFTVFVTPAQLTVTANNLSLVYGALPANLPFTITGYVNNDATNHPYTGAPLIVTTAVRNSPVGIYPITASGGTLASTKYTFTFAPATLTITPAPLTITAQPSTSTYGHIAPPFKYTITGLIPGDSPSVLGGTPFVATLATPASPVGTYPILIFGGALSSTNYNITLVQSTLTITPAVLTVTPTPLAVTYGQPLPALTFTISGLLNSELAQNSITGAPILSTTAVAQSTPGTYPIQASLGSLAASNYTFALQTGTLTIQKAPLTVVPNPATMVYGATVPAFSYTLSGFVFSDTASAVTGAPQLRTTASNFSPTGSYPITGAPGSLASANYTFTFAPASLTITPALLLVSANPAASTYGANPPSFLWSISGFVNRDSRTCVSGSPSLTTSASSASPVGAYAITTGPGTLTAQNYTFAFQNGTLTVNPAVLTVSATNLNSPYGTPIRPLTWAVSGFVNGDTLSAITGGPMLSTTALAQSSPGSYPISIAAGSLAAANYTFALQAGSYGIQKAVLTVTPNPATMVYGSVIPALTYTISGFAFNDSQATSVSGAPLLHATGTGYTPVGNYIITSAVGSLASANYTFAFASAPFTVTPAQLLVTANPLSTTYGASTPALTYAITGFVNRECRSAIAGAPILSTTATSASPAGSYPITAALGTLSAQNYVFTLQNATLSINPASLVVKGGSAQSLYGSAPPPLPYQISGFVNGDTLAAISGQPAAFTTATATSPAGKYPYNLAPGTLTAANYTFSFQPGSLTIGMATLVVSAQSATAVYGATVPAPAWQFSGFLNGDTAASLTGSPNCVTKANPTAGSYPITCSLGTLSSPNYTFTFAPGTLSITPAQLLVTAVSTSIVYGSGTAPTATTVTGFVYNDTAATAITGAPSLTAILNGSVGSTPIVVSQGTLAAANYRFAFAPGVLTITPAPLTLTAEDITMVQGASMPALTFSAKGLVNGDTLATAITGAPVLSTTATATSAPGGYLISIAPGTVGSANYTLTLVNGTFTINQPSSAHRTPRGIFTLSDS